MSCLRARHALRYRQEPIPWHPDMLIPIYNIRSSVGHVHMLPYSNCRCQIIIMTLAILDIMFWALQNRSKEYTA